MDEKLSVMELLKRAAKLLYSNTNLTLFLFLCSLPLFGFLIFFELSLQTTISLTYQFLSQELDLGSYFFHQDQEKDLSENDLIPWLIQTSLLYFFPCSLIDLFTTTMIVAASSIAYTSEEKKPLGMVYLVQRSAKICQNRLLGCLITSLYVLLLSTSVFFGFFSDLVNYLFITSLSRDYQNFHSQAAVLYHAVVVLIHGTIFIVLAVKFSNWGAGWNMGLVVSVLEEEEDKDGKGIYGTNALSLSYWYGRGHEKRDLWMMLMFLVLAIATRMPCLYSRCSESSNGNGVLYTSLYVGLICVGNVVKWVACVVSYYDCRARVLEKKDDVEIGSKAKAFAT